MTEPNPFVAMFEDPERARSYADGPANFTPGFSDMHRMVGVLLAEQAPEDAQVLVHGAGGGLELEVFAQTHPSWRLVGVDPALAMLDAARTRLGPLMARIELHHGFIDTAPDGPFDAATSLLTLHFLETQQRIQTVEEIVRRLKPGAPLVAVHSSFAQAEPAREQWLDRYEAYAVARGIDPGVAASARQAVSGMSTTYTPEQDAQILRDAGLTDVSMFYAAFTWRGWVGYAP